MEPFSKDDPLHQLLGKSRSVEPRPNFTQNVLRAVRQEPQKVGFWERCRAWLEEGGGARVLWRGSAIAAGAAVLVFSLVFWNQQTDSALPSKPVELVQVTPTTPAAPAGGQTPAAELPVEAVASELENLDHLRVMLAQQNTSALTDSEIASFLY